MAKQRIKGDPNRRVRMYQGEEVKPVLCGRFGGSRYMAGSISGKTICDDSGRPVPLKSIGKLEKEI